MVKKCCVRGCGNESYGGCKISFHSFPKDEKMRQKWLQFIPKNVTKYTVVCSYHFKPQDFTWLGSRNHLLPYAVPSLFPIPKDKKNKLTSNIKQLQPDPDSPSDSDSSTSISKEKKNKLMSNINLLDSDSDSSTSQDYLNERPNQNVSDEPPKKTFCTALVQTDKMVSSAEESLRKKVKVLSCCLKRREAKIRSLKNLLNLLRKKCDNFEEGKIGVQITPQI